MKKIAGILAASIRLLVMPLLLGYSFLHDPVPAYSCNVDGSLSDLGLHLQARASADQTEIGAAVQMDKLLALGLLLSCSPSSDRSAALSRLADAIGFLDAAQGQVSTAQSEIDDGLAALYDHCDGDTAAADFSLASSNLNRAEGFMKQASDLITQAEAVYDACKNIRPGPSFGGGWNNH